MGEVDGRGETSSLCALPLSLLCAPSPPALASVLNFRYVHAHQSHCHTNVALPPLRAPFYGGGGRQRRDILSLRPPSISSLCTLPSRPSLCVELPLRPRAPKPLPHKRRVAAPPGPILWGRWTAEERHPLSAPSLYLFSVHPPLPP